MVEGRQGWQEPKGLVLNTAASGEGFNVADTARVSIGERSFTAGEFFKRFAPEATSSATCARLCSMFAQFGNCKLGHFSRAVALADVPVSTDNVREPSDVLPLPIEAVRAFAEGLPCVLESADAAAVVDTTVGVVLALNFLFGAGWAKHFISPVLFSSLSDFQRVLVTDLVKACLDFMADAKSFVYATEWTDLMSKRINYCGEAVSVRRQLIADRVASGAVRGLLGVGFGLFVRKSA